MSESSSLLIFRSQDSSSEDVDFNCWWLGKSSSAKWACISYTTCGVINLDDEKWTRRVNTMPRWLNVLVTILLIFFRITVVTGDIVGYGYVLAANERQNSPRKTQVVSILKKIYTIAIQGTSLVLGHFGSQINFSPRISDMICFKKFNK